MPLVNDHRSGQQYQKTTRPSMIKKIIIFVFITVNIVTAQSVYEPVYNNEVYDFLRHLNLKGKITFNPEVTPLPRMQIAEKLLELNIKRSELTEVENSRLDFFLKEYFDETSRLKSDSDGIESGFFKSSGKQRLRFYNYSSRSFSISIDPVLGLNFGNNYGGDYRHRWNGAGFFGYLGDNWGFSMDFRDNEERGKNLDSVKTFTPSSGINRMITGDNYFEYSEVNAMLSYSWSSGAISIGKEHINWGSAAGGKLIMSDKAPSFPMIRLDVQPLDWLRFTFIHGWLHSGITDSTAFRTSLVENRDSYSPVPKFIAAHLISADITDELTVSIGESMIYGDELEPLYLIPVMFFRLADHYLADRESNTGDNAQLFADVSYKIPSLRSGLYSSVFIDELSITNLLKGKNLSAVAFTLGGMIADPVIPNSSFTVEYTRLNPFVYMNSDPVHLYTNHGYQLGHWIGSNGDQLFASYTQYLSAQLKFNVEMKYVRKGQTELPEQQYRLPYPSFLYGARLSQMLLDFSVRYEFIHSLVAEAYYQYRKTEDEEAGRVFEFVKGRKNSFGLKLYYGL